MNTRNAYNIRASKPQANSNSLRRAGATAPVGLAVSDAPAMPHPACASLPAASCRHPLTDGHMNARLAHCEDSVKGRFDLIAPTLKNIAGMPRGAGFAGQAAAAQETA